MARPLKFESPEELDAAINRYFAKRLDEDGYPILTDKGDIKYPITLTGLAVYLGTSRETIDNYQDRPEFFDSVKRAKDMVEAYYECRLVYGNATGSIFALKNFGWKDTHDHNVGGQKDNPLVSEVKLAPDEAYRRMLDGK